MPSHRLYYEHRLGACILLDDRQRRALIVRCAGWGAGSDGWRASTTDNGDGTYAVQFQLMQAGPWTILPR